LQKFGQIIPLCALRFLASEALAQALQQTLQVSHKGYSMLRLALVLLIVALIAGLFGLTGIAGLSVTVAWIVFVVGLLLALAPFIFGRRPFFKRDSQ
jgi:uncharacterized membrane protein YtjA (UPF0391 family)